MKNNGGQEPKERKLAMLRFIDRYRREHGMSPTVREIGEHLGILSTSHCDYYLRKLEEEGLIERQPKRARTIRLTEAGLQAIGGVAQETVPAPAMDERVAVPFLGYIVASEPLPVEPLVGDETIEINPALLGTVDDGLFALRVRGHSMIDALIGDGDLVLFRHQERVENGEMAAVWIVDRQETTLKRIYWEGERVRLQPANPTMAPIYEEADNIRIQGKVVLVVRRLD